MTRKFVLSFAASAALAAPLALGPPAHADTPAVTLTDVQITPTTVSMDAPDLTYRGRVVDADGAPVANQRLCGRTPDGICSGVVVSGADGRFDFTKRLFSNYRTVSMRDGDAAVALLNSPLAPVGTTRITVTRQDTRVTIAPPVTTPVGRAGTVTGRLERHATDGRWVGIARERVALRAYDRRAGRTVELGDAITEADGGYAAEITVPAATSWTAQFYGIVWTDGTGIAQPYRHSNATVWPQATQYDTTLTGFTLSPKPAGAGGPLRASVQLRRADGTPAPQAYVGVSYSADNRTWRRVGADLTDARGRIDLTLSADKSGYWRAEFDGDESHRATSPTAPQYVQVKTRTAFASFNAAPEPVRKGATLTVSGRLNRHQGAWYPAGRGAKVTIAFRPDGSTAWTTVGTTTTADRGSFRKSFKASRSGTWRASYAGSTTYLGATSGGDHVQVGTKTAFTSFNASPEPVRKGGRLTAAGRLTRHLGSWQPASGATVRIQFKPAGSSTWTTLGTAKTGKKGTFARSFTATKDGTWRAVYAGSTTYLPSTGKTDYVDVR